MLGQLFGAGRRPPWQTRQGMVMVTQAYRPKQTESKPTRLQIPNTQNGIRLGGLLSNICSDLDRIIYVRVGFYADFRGLRITCEPRWWTYYEGVTLTTRPAPTVYTSNHQHSPYKINRPKSEQTQPHPWGLAPT